MKYHLLLIKRTLEDILMFPLILLGRIVTAFKRPAKEYDVYYFFPFYHTGGAEKVHALIAQTTATNNSIIFFTRKSQNQTFLSLFQETGCEIRDVSKYTDNKWLYFFNIIYRGIISAQINRQQKKPVVFNGQCNFGYKLSPWIRKDIRQIELIHSVNSFSYIRIPFLPFIDATVMISTRKIEEHKALYKRFDIPADFTRKLHYIPNASYFESISIAEKEFSTVRVLYSGRATTEKRPHLFAAIAKKLHQQDNSIEFLMAGDEFEMLRSDDSTQIEFKGNIADPSILGQLYRHCNVLLLPSSTEGFPLAVIEAMAYGCAIVATPVGDIPVHVQQGQNGFLFSSVEDEERIITEGVNFLLHLKQNKELHRAMAEANIAYAHHNFTLQKFGEAYKKLIYS